MTIKTVFPLLGMLLLTTAQAANAQDSAKLAIKKRIVNLDSVQNGVASYYAGKFQGRLTASGERYDSLKLTAA